jgi:hypothetical protein
MLGVSAIKGETVMRRFAASCALLLAAMPAHAAYQNGNQVIEDFDALTNPWDGVITLILPAKVSGGTVATEGAGLDPAYPPYTVRNVYFGGEITVQLDDPYNDSYPAFGAWVTGSAVVTLDVYAYDPDLAIEVLYGSAASDGDNRLGSGRDPNFHLWFANPPGGALLTRAVFRSTEGFALDNLELGLPDGPVGIPEPASWATLIAGFALAGGALRVRRRVSV